MLVPLAKLFHTVSTQNFTASADDEGVCALTLPQTLKGTLKSYTLRGMTLQGSNPSPENPMPLICTPPAFQLQSCGKNLIDESQWSDRTVFEGKNCLYGNGYYYLGTGVRSGNPITFTVPIQKGKTYTLRGSVKLGIYDRPIRLTRNMMQGMPITIQNIGFYNDFADVSVTFVPQQNWTHLFVDTGDVSQMGYLLENTLALWEGTDARFCPYEGAVYPLCVEDLAENLYPLRSLPDGTADTVYTQDNWYISQRVGVVTVDDHASGITAFAHPDIDGLAFNLPMGPKKQGIYGLFCTTGVSASGSAGKAFETEDGVFLAVEKGMTLTQAQALYEGVQIFYRLDEAYQSPVLLKPLPDIATYGGQTRLFTRAPVTLSVNAYTLS